MREWSEHCSCAEAPVVFPDGSELPQIPFGSETPEWHSDHCHDCGTPKGGFHHPPCDAEECPRCHGQLIACGCLDDPDDIVGDVVGRPHIPAETLEQLFGSTPERPSPDDILEDIRWKIVDAGWTVVAIGAGPCACCGETEHEGPSFLYTIGLTTTFDRPELIVFGLPPQAAHGLISVVIEQLREGASFVPGTVYDEITDLPLAFIEVPKDEFSGRLNFASAIYGDEIKALQLVWPDGAGRFPWDVDFDEFLRGEQTLLGTWPGAIQ